MSFFAEIFVTTIESPTLALAPTPALAPAPASQTSEDGTIEGSLRPEDKMVHVDPCMKLQNVVLVARIDAQTHNIRSRVCSFAKSVVPSACVCHPELTATRRYAHATTIGRPNGEDPYALEC
ncbi:hypothetical protein CR513_35827, partial [Mucuna pruriens]